MKRLRDAGVLLAFARASRRAIRSAEGIEEARNDQGIRQLKGPCAEWVDASVLDAARSPFGNLLERRRNAGHLRIGVENDLGRQAADQVMRIEAIVGGVAG